ncbi:hypothetical protein Hanom_Chr03g00201581 [Helianthus anomalus]
MCVYAYTSCIHTYVRDAQMCAHTHRCMCTSNLLFMPVSSPDVYVQGIICFDIV